MKKEKSEKVEMPEMTVSEALHHLEKAEDIKADAKLMAKIKKHHTKMGKVVKSTPVKSIKELRKAAEDAFQGKDTEDYD